MPQAAFSPDFNDYSVEAQAIARRRRMAEMLQAQSLEPLPTNQTVGGMAIPISPLQGMAQMLKAGVAGYGEKQATEQEKALGERYRTELADTITKAMQAGTGRPASAEIPAATDEAMGGPWRPAMPAVAPNQAKMAEILMQHPATQQAGIQKMMSDMNRQALIQALTGQTGQPQPTAAAPPAMPTGAAGAPAMPPTGQAPNAAAGPAVGGPAGGVPMMAWLQADPTGKTYMEALAKDYAASRTLTRVNPGGAAVNQAGQPMFVSPTNEGRVTNYGPQGPTQSLVPGALAIQEQLGNVPMQEVTNADQTKSYVPKSQLAGAARANPIPQASAQLPPQLANSRDYANANPQEQAAIRQLFDATQRGQPAAVSVPNSPGAPNPIPSGAVLPTSGPPRFGQTQEQQIQQQRQAAGGKALDEQFAKDYASFVQGGAADTSRQLAQLGDVITALGTKGANLTGPIIGGTPDVIKKFTNPQSIAMRERVEEVVQRSLRSILGAQFTEKEGERLIARAYNPNQPEAENMIRVQRLYAQLNQAFKAKQDAAQYFEKNGTLMGWQGKLPSIGDFDVSGGTSGQINNPQDIVDELRRRGVVK